MAKLALELLKGVNHTEVVQVDHNGTSYEIEIRPLTHTERAEIQAIETGSAKMNQSVSGKTKMSTQSMEMSVGALVKDQAKAKLKKIEIATLDPEWTAETVDQYWPTEWIETVSNRINQLSGVERDGEAIDSFRTKQ